MVERFRQGQRPLETFEDGVAVVELLMALYKSAETGQTVTLPDAGLEDFVPAVARGLYRG
jgi:predicted dehydrogenase